MVGWLVGWWVEWFVYEWWIEMRLQGLDLCEEDLAQPLTPSSAQSSAHDDHSQKFSLGGTSGPKLFGICALSTQSVSIF